MNRIGDEDALYVTAVLLLYLELPDTPSRPGAGDQSLARKLHQDAVPLPLVESALLLGSLRRMERPSDRPPAPGQDPFSRLLHASHCRDATTASPTRLPRLSSPQVQEHYPGCPARCSEIYAFRGS